MEAPYSRSHAQLCPHILFHSERHHIREEDALTSISLWLQEQQRLVLCSYLPQTANDFQTRCHKITLAATCVKLRFRVSKMKLTPFSRQEQCSRVKLQRWKEFYLKGEVYKAVHPPPIWGCSGELSAQAGEHRHLHQLQTVLLQVLFKEHTGVPLQHLKGHLPHLRQQVLVITRPFLSGKSTSKWQMLMLQFSYSLAFLDKCLFEHLWQLSSSFGFGFVDLVFKAKVIFGVCVQSNI